SAAFVCASSLASLSFSWRSFSFSISAGLRPGLRVLGSSALRAPPLRALRHSEMWEVSSRSRRSSAPLPAVSACSYSSRMASLYSAVKVRRFGRSEPDALEEVPTRSSCPAVSVRSVMLNVTVKKIPFSPCLCHLRSACPHVSHQSGREGAGRPPHGSPHPAPESGRSLLEATCAYSAYSETGQ